MTDWSQISDDSLRRHLAIAWKVETNYRADLDRATTHVEEILQEMEAREAKAEAEKQRQETPIEEFHRFLQQHVDRLHEPPDSATAQVRLEKRRTAEYILHLFERMVLKP